MPSLCRRLNFGNVELHADTRSDSVGVLLRNGDYRYQHWLSFIDEENARHLPSALPVLLQATRYCDDDGSVPAWIEVPAGHFVQGCLIDAGVYAVTQGRVRVKLVTKDSVETATRS